MSKKPVKKSAAEVAEFKKAQKALLTELKPLNGLKLLYYIIIVANLALDTYVALFLQGIIDKAVEGQLSNIVPSIIIAAALILLSVLISGGFSYVRTHITILAPKRAALSMFSKMLKIKPTQTDTGSMLGLLGNDLRSVNGYAGIL